ncbi:MAG: GNAT family N-acetyltransferase [Oligoflexia bacterium]|nr:GNAT family N-acetyltransferase [Oligoflexia bacterium]
MDFDRSSTDIRIRTLTQGDLARLVAMDAQHTGRTRSTWFEGRLSRALATSDVRVSLGAEIDGTLVGAVLGMVQYGEYGVAEPVAVVDTILVDQRYGGQHIGASLMEHLARNLTAFHIERIRTEVAWDQQHLLHFLGHSGFVLAQRLVLERELLG